MANPDPSIDPFPELESERERLGFSRACRDRMIERFSGVDPDAAADEITKEYVEVTVGEALEDLRSPGAGDFFGRITEDRAHAVGAHSGAHTSSGDTWYIGRRHIEDDVHDPVVVDWRAPIAAPFYRATGIDPLGLSHRRRFTLVDGDVTAYLDEQLDDPDAASAATGVPDPVLAEIGAARTGAMREIVATIQAEQDVVIRAPIDQCLVVQGGPGTGKTAVGLHRAAYLLFEHRRRLMRDGVLVVGPNPVFLDYIGNVLPSLGERSVQQKTALDLCIPKLDDLAGVDSDDDREHKGSAAMLAAVEAAVTRHVSTPSERVHQPLGARTLVFEVDEMAEWIARALDGNLPVNRRRQSLRPIIEREVLQRTGSDAAFAKLDVLRSVLQRAWPVVQPVRLIDQLLAEHGFGPSGRRRRWTVADQLLVDEANTLLNGTPFTFGHLVVDEAQDHSAVALRVIGRRSPSGSMTVLGDLAQSTTPAGQRDWDVALGHLTRAAGSVAHLTIGYRVPGPILDVANRLLPFTAVDTVASTSVRFEGSAPSFTRVEPTALAAAVAAEVLVVRHRHHNTGIVAPEHLFAPIGAALAAVGLRAAGRVQHLDHDEVPIFSAEAVKGLEFDGVVGVNPHQILAGTERGARLLYVAMTRAVQTLHLVGDAELPAELDAPRV
ncbi:MAG: ATP-binding domain-containing protein [Actinomycetota bacterium]